MMQENQEVSNIQPVMDENIENAINDDDFYYAKEEEAVEQPSIVIPNIELPKMGDFAPVEPTETVADTIPSFSDIDSSNEELTLEETKIPTLEDNVVPEKENDDFIDVVPSFKEENISELPDFGNISFSVPEQAQEVVSNENGNFDSLFDSLYNDVNGANNFISDMLTQKKRVQDYETNLKNTKEKLDKEREEFASYIEAQRKIIETEKAQCNEFVRNQRLRIQNEEAKFNSDCEATRAEITLEEEKIKIANEKLADEKEQFKKVQEIEEEKIKTDREKLKMEQEQWEREKAIALEKIKQGQVELENQKEQFAKAKELEEKKLELESKNLSQSCARFKELVSQFNSGFQQLPGDKEQ